MKLRRWLIHSSFAKLAPLAIGCVPPAYGTSWYDTGLPTLLFFAGLLSRRMVERSNFCAACCSVRTVRCTVCMVLVRGPPRVLGSTTGSTSVSVFCSPSTSRSRRKL
ncbi:hypothetical protein D9M69_665230 [compost metagenome]